MKKISRRELLKLGGTGAAAVAGAAATVAATARAEAQPRAQRRSSRKAPSTDSANLPQIPRRVLGKTGQSIPILLVGGSMPWDRNFDPRLPEAVRFGANYFDSARGYAGSERALANFHRRAKARDQIWITSKSKAHDPKGFESSLATSLRELDTDRVDMYYLHGLSDASYLSSELERTVARLKKSGKMRYFGFSCHHGNVAELLSKAAELDWIDSVMFRYNFRQYGDKALNKAIDAAHRADVGLIAMKTQGSEASFRDAWKKFEKTGKWNKFQAVLKAVWADQRITAAVSEMTSFDQMRENIAAAVDRTELSAIDRQALDRYARDTRALACDGCDHLCGAAAGAPVRIGDTMRYLMYAETYGKVERARDLFRALPAAARDLNSGDFGAASAACPHGVDLVAHMDRAKRLFSS
ncbi:MAG: aldo/keto reductase [Myxococcota bacterium]